uniref:Uncharacterized protein n=1 Tax=Anguilla anguilla TaxID=7936 RepID=A0A0E9W9D3_ANGAN
MGKLVVMRHIVVPLIHTLVKGGRLL